MSSPEHPIFAKLYDPVMTIPERTVLPKHREYLIENIEGTILDIGSGTGAMFPYYAILEPNTCSFHAIEPDPHMRSQASKRAADLELDIEIREAGAEELPYPDNTFDYVIAAIVFCTIPDVETALDEIARVLKPGGEFRFVEHVRATGTVGRIHDTVTPVWQRVAGGCNLNRETGKIFRTDDRFQLLEYSRFDSGPGKLAPFVRGKMKRRSDTLIERVFR